MRLKCLWALSNACGQNDIERDQNGIRRDQNGQGRGQNAVRFNDLDPIVSLSTCIAYILQLSSAKPSNENLAWSKIGK